MREFSDLVTPNYREVVLDWLLRVLELPESTFPAPEPRKWSVQRRVRTLLNKALNPAYDPLQTWGNWDVEFKRGLSLGLGEPYPRMTIDLAPYEEAEEYAIKDAIVTRRLARRFLEL